MTKKYGAILIGLVLLVQACTVNEVVREAKLAYTAAKAAAPIVAIYLPNDKVLIDQIVAGTGKLIDAVDKADATSAVALLDQLIPTFESIVSDTGQLPADVQVKVLGGLALLDIALNFLANYYQQNQTALAKLGARAPGGAIAAFAAKRPFGFKYIH